MQSIEIFWPLLVVLAIPVFVLLLNGNRKSKDRKAGIAKPQAAINNSAWSLPVVLTSNALANQFQLPVVFYVLSFVLFNINAVSSLVLVLCWVFAITRWAHVVVHVSSNYVPLRMSFFLLGAITLLILFGVTVVALANLA
ncbi:MAG: hypothetical protein ACJAQ6_001412 [Arenicella sp.]|jgi:hypothetical protein